MSWTLVALQFSFAKVITGRHQERLAWARIRAPISWQEIERRVHHQENVWDFIRSFQVVGLGCNCGDTSVVPRSILRHSQVQGESFAVVSDPLFQESTATS